MLQPVYPPGKEHPSIHWIGSWMGPWASLDAVARRKYPSPCQQVNPSSPAHSLVTTLTELPWYTLWNKLLILKLILTICELQTKYNKRWKLKNISSTAISWIIMTWFLCHSYFGTSIWSAYQISLNLLITT